MWYNYGRTHNCKSTLWLAVCMRRRLCKSDISFSYLDNGRTTITTHGRVAIGRMRVVIGRDWSLARLVAPSLAAQRCSLGLGPL
jgi:hypothetical protein